MKVTILVNAPESWVLPYAEALTRKLSGRHEAALVRRNEDLPRGDICFLLGCTRIVPAPLLARHRRNLVIHGSDLPRGRGFSPLQWQILEGADEIPMVLFEASEGVDEGPIYSRRVLRLDGTELLGELRRKQWAVMEEMIEEFLLQPDRAGVPQEGEPSTYRRRTREDDELPLDQTLEELFPRLRIADNENWPVYFRRAGRTYVLKIYPGDS